MTYSYTLVDRLRHPPDYTYADYRGTRFLEEYLEDRLHRLKVRCGTPHSCKGTHEEAHQVVHKLCNRNGTFPPRGTEQYLGAPSDVARFTSSCLPRHRIEFTADIKTAQLLTALLHLLTCDSAGNNKAVSESLPWCELLVKRFEVSKKLYEGYGPGLRNGYGGAENIYLYEQFALVLCLIYLHTNRLSFLSALLKVNDLLLSLPLAQVLDRKGSDHGGLALAVAVELHAVRRLAQLQGVDLGVK